MRMVEFKPVKGYEMINDNLGSGSFGQTVLLRDPSLDELFVCKKYLPQPGLKPADFFQAFKKEIKMMYRINHPNVARVFTYYLYEEIYAGYIIMEYIKGVNIDNWFGLYDLWKQSSNEIFRQLIEAFACIENNGIVHRDIRESNILISTDDGVVKIIDFGLGKHISESGMSLDSFNTLIERRQMQKLPKEFEEGKYTSLTDMFCVAELYNRMLKKYNIDDFKHGYILQKMMQYDPAQRYKSFSEILEALDKKDFKHLEISEEEKEIYNDFIGSMIDCIGEYSEDKNLETSCSRILDKLSEILESNCLNPYVEDTSSVIAVFVKNDYSYYKSRKIFTNVIQRFYDWLISKDDNFQAIVMKNIISRLNAIPVVKDDMPF